MDTLVHDKAIAGSGLSRPDDAERPGIGIVHLGFGAIYTAEAMQASDCDWGINGVSLPAKDQRDLLTPQGCACFAAELGQMAQQLGLSLSFKTFWSHRKTHLR